MIRRSPRSVAISLAGLCATLALALSVMAAGAAPASAAGAPCFAQLPGLGGIPPWGYHTGAPLTGTTGWYARAYGDINLDANTISGKICQAHFVHGHEGLITMRPLSPIIFHTHHAVLYGYPGNLITAHVKVTASTDRTCRVGTVGVMTMYGSYNNVRSDSVQYRFPTACRHEDHLYHGPQVNAQVPPL